MGQLHRLGKWIRNEYNDLIDNKFDTTRTLIKSSDTDRTIMSAESLLAALFRPEPKDYFIDDLPWLPVPIHTLPTKLDNVDIIYKY